MNDKPKSRWYWRWLRRGLIALAVLATLIAVAITEENWRGKRDWEDYKRQAAARGDLLEETATNNIPDDQNFAKAPIFAALAAMQWNVKEGDWEPRDTNVVDRAKMSVARWDGTWPEHANGDWNRGRLTDLKAWQTYYRTAPTNSSASSNSEGRVLRVPISTNSSAADVLLALGIYDAAIEELRTDSQRPFSRFGNYDWANPQSMSLNLVYLSEMKGFCSVLQLRAIAELAADQNSKALDDIELLLRLNDKLRQEPLLITHLVSLATMNLALQPIYEGLAQHKWSEAQLAELEQTLAAKDFLVDYQTAMRGERAFAISALDDMRLTREYKTEDDSSGTGKVTTISFRLVPSAFFYQNELTVARIHEQFFLPLVDLEKRIVSPSAQRQASVALAEEAKHYQPYKILALMSAQAITKTVEKFAVVQSQTDFARIACALERYRLARGSYPEALDALAPQFIEAIPHDVINGQPLHYRRTEDGNFLLYSVGWNETDDQGQIVANKTGGIDREKGDWVWRYPVK